MCNIYCPLDNCKLHILYRNINEASRQLWGPNVSYGAVDGAEEGEENTNDDNIGSNLPDRASELGGMTYGGEIEISRKAGRSGSISKRDGSNQKKDNSYDRYVSILMI